MAIVSLVLLAATLLALLFPWGIHEALAVALAVPLVLHNAGSKAFYEKLLGRAPLDRSRGDIAVIAALGMAFAAAYVSGVMLFLAAEFGVALSLIGFWKIVHMAAAIAAAALTVLHMKREWS